MINPEHMMKEKEKNPTVFSSIEFFQGYEIRKSSKSDTYWIFKNDKHMQGKDGFGDPFLDLEYAKRAIDPSRLK